MKPKDNYDHGVTNEQQNQSVFAHFNSVLFVSAGIILIASKILGS